MVLQVRRSVQLVRAQERRRTLDAQDTRIMISQFQSQSTMSGAGSNIQWKLYGTSSWTDTTAANTHTGTYYKQLDNTYQETANSQSTFDTSMSWVVTGTVGGVGSTTVCTISSTAAATDSCSGYADYDLGVTIPQAVTSPPSGTRWQSSAACTFTQTTGGNTNNCNSYKQTR